MDAPSACNIQPWEFIVIRDPRPAEAVIAPARNAHYSVNTIIVVYSLTRDGRLDGLIAWKGHLIRNLAGGETAEFYRRYGVPMVTVKGRLPGFSCGTYGSYDGMKMVVDHLAGVHGFAKIGFLGLIESHPASKNGTAGTARPWRSTASRSIPA